MQRLTDMKGLIFVSLATVLLAASIAGEAPKSTSLPYFCYWMENASGRYEWVPAEVGGIYHGEGYERCQALDSCSGGLSESNGGCYKWARSAQSAAVKWVGSPKR